MTFAELIQGGKEVGMFLLLLYTLSRIVPAIERLDRTVAGMRGLMHVLYFQATGQEPPTPEPGKGRSR